MTTTPALNARWAAVLAGFSRGWIETRQSFTETMNIVVLWFPPTLYVVMMLAINRMTSPGTHFSPSAVVLPGFLCITIILGGLTGPTAGITSDRQDGTLLRAKATPNGMLGYLVGKIVLITLTTLLSCVVILVPGIMIAHLILDAGAWLLLTLIFVVGMVSIVPLGVALGSVMKPLQVPLVPLLSILITMVSGVFIPLTYMPTWLQSLIRAFPIYWVGLGIRSAMLPPAMVAAEIGKWRAAEMFAVPGVWAAVGLLLAPILLRRMARLQSGSALRTLARGGR